MTQTTDRQTATDTATDITIFQQAFVADHIAGLRREADALRAERERDHRNEVHSSDPAAHHSAIDSVPTRVRGATAPETKPSTGPPDLQGEDRRDDPRQRLSHTAAHSHSQAGSQS